MLFFLCLESLFAELLKFDRHLTGAVKEAIGSLRKSSVNAFVLDLRDNR